MSAMPMGMPGWPELAAWTASMARKRMALARSRRAGVVIGLDWGLGSDGAERAVAPAKGAIVPQRGKWTAVRLCPIAVAKASRGATDASNGVANASNGLPMPRMGPRPCTTRRDRGHHVDWRMPRTPLRPQGGVLAHQGSNLWLHHPVGGGACPHGTEKAGLCGPA